MTLIIVHGDFELNRLILILNDIRLVDTLNIVQVVDMLMWLRHDFYVTNIGYHLGV